MSDMNRAMTLILAVGIVANLALAVMAMGAGDMGRVVVSLVLAALCAGVIWLRMRGAN